MTRTPRDIEDELLVLHCQRGNRRALQPLIERWRPRLLRMAWRLLADREAAQDITQEACLAIVRDLRRLQDPALFRSWAFRILVNKCTDWTRRRATQRAAQGVLQDAARAATTGAAERSDSDDDTRRVRQAMCALPDDQRTVLALHYLEGMGLTEIARVLEIPKGTVKSRLFNARRHLEQAMERVRS